jgi:uncharacterized protein YdbL (DUF1318 family)
MTKRSFLRSFAALLLLAFAAGAPLAPAMAQSLNDLKAQGIVGERPDGLVGLVSAAAPSNAQAFVSQLNAQRMQNYQKIAQDTGAPLDAVQARAGAQLTAATPPGQFVMNAAGQWMKK